MGCFQHPDRGCKQGWDEEPVCGLHATSCSLVAPTAGTQQHPRQQLQMMSHTTREPMAPTPLCFVEQEPKPADGIIHHPCTSCLHPRVTHCPPACRPCRPHGEHGHKPPADSAKMLTRSSQDSFALESSGKELA